MIETKERHSHNHHRDGTSEWLGFQLHRKYRKYDSHVACGEHEGERSNNWLLQVPLL